MTGRQNLIGPSRSTETPAGTETLPLLHELFQQRACAQPDAPALDGLSYRELDAWAARIAHALKETGIEYGKPIAVCLPPGGPHVAALLGILKAGCYFVPVSTSDSLERCVEILREVQPAGLLGAADLPRDDLNSWFRGTGSGAVVAVSPWGEVTVSPAEPETTDHHKVPVDPDAPAYVVYTSGSTGKPKGVVQSHSALAQLVCWMGAEFRMGPGRRIAQWAATNYDASICEVFATLIAGGTLCPVPDHIRFDAGQTAAWLAEQRVNLFQSVPSFGREILHALNSTTAAPDLSAVDHMLFAGETFPGVLGQEMSKAVSGVRLINLYGPTETILATWADVTDHLGDNPVPVGKAIPGREVLVLDSTDTLCPPGTTGEIVVCSEVLPSRYVGVAPSTGPRYDTIRRPAGHADAPEVRCYRTGDQGCWRDDGLLEFRGRRDRQVKLRGIRVELTAIEDALISHPSVVDCVVIPQDGQDELVEQLVAYVVPAQEIHSIRTWRAHLKERLGEQFIPSSFVTMAALPRNAGGKIDTSALPGLGESTGARRAPRSGSRAARFRAWSGEIATPSESEGRQS
ncbi:amino acid adenylation domain-containing protein [Streptomyces sp. NPDC001220]